MTGRIDMSMTPWPQIGSDELVVVALGSVEQHGPHLPLDTDTRIAMAVIGRACEAGLSATIAPPLNYGASGEHETFAGTVSIGLQVLTAMLVEFGRSACRWARRVVFVNGHGGNISALADAVGQLRYEARDVAWFACAPRHATVDAHAGFTETSLLLHISPDVVATSAMSMGAVEPLSEVMDRLRIGGVGAVSANGVLGDPTLATASEGERMLEELGVRLRDVASRWSPDERGMLR